MNIFSELFENKFPGNFRAQIIEVNTEKKNGIYKVRTFPVHTDVEEQYLPWAVSNLTNKFQNINLKKDDFVWIFFENEDPNFPVIFNICNFKDSYPKASSGTKPDYYNNITKESSIDENDVNYNGEYNSFTSFDYGENIFFDIDEKNKQVVLYSDNWYVVLDKDKCLHLKFEKIFLKANTLFNLKVGNNVIKINSDGIKLTDKSNNVIELNSSGTKITDKNNNIVEMKNTGISITDKNNNTIVTDSTSITLNNNLKVLK